MFFVRTNRHASMFKVVSKTKHLKTKAEAWSTQISKAKHPKLENEAPKYRNHCRLQDYNFKSLTPRLVPSPSWFETRQCWGADRNWGKCLSPRSGRALIDSPAFGMNEFLHVPSMGLLIIWGESACLARLAHFISLAQLMPWSYKTFVVFIWERGMAQSAEILVTLLALAGSPYKQVLTSL